VFSRAIDTRLVVFARAIDSRGGTLCPDGGWTCQVVMSVNSLSRQKEGGDGGEMVVCKKVMEKWWIWARWVVVMMVVFIFLGLVFSMNVLNDVSVLIFFCLYFTHLVLKAFPMPVLFNLFHTVGFVFEPS
jgi:hypothetical protein